MKNRGVSPVIAIVLMVAVTVLLATTAAVFFDDLVPNLSQSGQPEGSFSLERTTDGKIVATPDYIDNGAKFQLKVNGVTIYEWTGGNSLSTRTVTCLFPGDRVTIVNKQGRQTYIQQSYTVDEKLDCAVNGTARKFAFVKSGDREVPLREQKYEFTMEVDPDGSNSVKGDKDFALTNDWHYVKRVTGKTVEGYSPPVYLVIVADNANYDSTPPDDYDPTSAYNLTDDDGDGDYDFVPTPSSDNEPANDIYFVFKPGCDTSKLTFTAERAGYSNDILLDGDVIIDNTNDVSTGTTYDVGGVKCLSN